MYHVEHDIASNTFGIWDENCRAFNCQPLRVQEHADDLCWVLNFANRARGESLARLLAEDRELIGL